MSKLPPLHNLPSWSRSSLERRKIQRCIAKDPFVPANKTEMVSSANVNRSCTGQVRSSEKLNSSVRIVSAPSSATQEQKLISRRESQLRNSIAFLQQQHQETLAKLHEEIDKLKSENKESKPRTGSYYRSKIRRLENEMKNVKLALIEAQKQNVDLSKRLHERELSGKRYKPLPPVSSGKQKTAQSSNGMAETRSSSRNTAQVPSSENTEKRDQTSEHLNLFSPGKTTVLQVTLGKKGEIFVKPSTGAGSRSPTMSECKDIIHYLEDTNKRQGQELSRLKEELRGGNYPAKFSPETYLVTKTLSGRSGYDKNSVMLPALRPAGSGNVADRRRGQQAVLRGREKRDVNF